MKRPFVYLLSLIFYFNFLRPTPIIWAVSNDVSLQPNSLKLFRKLMESPKDPSKTRTYHYLPRLPRLHLEKDVIRLLEREKSTDLRNSLVLGMGESGNSLYIEPLMRAFPKASPDLQRSIAEALGKLNAKESIEILRDYLRSRDHWYANTVVTEAVINAMGALGDSQAEALFEPIQRQLPHHQIFAIIFTHQPQKDRLAGALAWAYGEMKIEEKHLHFIKALFQSQSPRSSILAAGVLLIRKNDGKAKQYLLDLVQNPSVSMELRNLCAKILAKKYGDQTFEKIVFYGNQGLQIQLTIAREMSPKKLVISQARKFLTFSDENLIAEGALVLAQKGQAKDRTQIRNKLEEVESQFLKATLTYAWEGIASR